MKIKSVLTYLERSAREYKNKLAVFDGSLALTYEKLEELSRNLAYKFYEIRQDKKEIDYSSTLLYLDKSPIVFFMEKSSLTLAGFFASAYAGAPYTLLNPEFPDHRLLYMVDLLESKIIVTNEQYKDRAEEIFNKANVECKILTIESLLDSLNGIDTELRDRTLDLIRRKAIDTDPLYINFTSGSTGNPKGIVVSHRSTIDFIEEFVEVCGIDSSDIIGNQAPFDFDVSVKDIYSSICVGANLIIIPREYFSRPKDLIDYLVENKVTNLTWAVSALCLVSTFHGLDYKTPEDVRRIVFSGEVMPLKHLYEWRKHLPEAAFINVYGPTEITCNCTYHILDKTNEYSEYIPIGKAFLNEDVFLLDSDSKLITSVETVGEICVRGSALALGYYKNPMQNEKAFVQNPLNNLYPELIYRTGDLAWYNENLDLVFSGRKDFQIKYQGHRIELEEIERVVSKIDGIERCICIFEERKSKLKCFYLGDIEKTELVDEMQKLLPFYMIPRVIKRVENMPLNKNGKVDRKKLAEIAD